MKNRKLSALILVVIFFTIGCVDKEENEVNSLREEEAIEDISEPQNEEEKNLDTKEGEEVMLVLSQAFEEAGQNAENNELVALAEVFLANNPDLGDEGLTITYTGKYYTENEDFYGVFLLTNKSGKVINDMSFRFSWAYDEENIIEDLLVNYYAEEMNTLPDNSTILLLLPVESEKQELVKNIDTAEKLSFFIDDIVVTR